MEWDGQVAARYDARKNNKPHKALEILDYAREYAPLSEKTRQRIDNGKFPITNLERLINTPYVRKKLGLDIAPDGRLVIVYPEEEVLKGLTHVIEDLGTSKVTVSKIKSQEQRIDYINGLSKDELPNTDQPLTETRLFGKPPNNTNSSRTNYVAKPKSKNYNRTTLIPRDCKLNVTHHRINNIYKELKDLNIDDFPNAGAVMFRVFVELSLDYFLEHNANWPEQQIANSTLAQKLTASTNHLANVLTQGQSDYLKKVAGGQTLLAASIKTMHGYVHNRHFSPVSSELKTAWNDLQIFLEKIWPR